MPVPEPIDHSVDKRPSEEDSSPVDIVTAPEPIEHSGVRGGRCSAFCWSADGALGLFRELAAWSHEAGETIVVGAVGSAAPWFLMGWADGVEVQFMIDAGCPVTILATSVFERMCASDPRMRS